MILSGHFHLGHAASWTHHYPAFDHAAILVQAGTATSSRRRDEANSWNLIRIERPDVVIERQTWEPARKCFTPSLRETFQLGEGGWMPSRKRRTYRHKRADACHVPAESGTEWRFACLIVSSLLFAALAVAVVLGVTDSFDARRAAGINRWASPNLTLLAEALSFIGSVAVLLR